MSQAFITELAASDLSKIWLYIARDNPDAADRFVEKLRAACDRLAQSPALGRNRTELAFGLRSPMDFITSEGA